MLPCWSRRRVRARPRSFRCIFLAHHGADNRTIILLEPRRLAARAAASRMASLLGEDVGATVGYRMRLENKVSAKTRILVVTEGVFARMILDDPDLKDIAAVLFDEFHERSLDADFGLALALDVQAALRPDLKLLVMSATLDGARVAKLLERCAGTGKQGPLLSHRYPLPATQSRRADRGRHGQGHPRYACRRDRQHPCLPARPARDRTYRRSAARTRARRCDDRAALRCTRRPRSGRGDQAAHLPASARWCLPPPSPKPRSPSMACASSSTAAWRVCRSSNPPPG